MRHSDFLRRWIKDPFPGLSHWLGLALSIGGLVFLLILGAGRAGRMTACAIYGATLIVLYAASALAHLFTAPRGRPIVSRASITSRFFC